MKVVIFSGGTGSIALQTGIYSAYGENVDYYVITNAYDNGKSTGAVRTVYDGKILGPSDVRKNQTLRHRLMWCSSSKTAMYELLDHRFNAETESAELYCLNYVNKKLKENITSEYTPPEETLKVFEYAIKHYFRQPKATQIPYVDFSLANIIYAGIAAQNNFSLEKAATIMAHILQIPDNVILNSDESLFLGAITQSRHIITDEGEIVEWENDEDKIVDITLVDETGKFKLPTFSDRAIKITKDADIIILSSGTLWSSLIPTYASHKFENALRESKAYSRNAVYAVINNIQDKDMYGINALGHIEIISSYIGKSNIYYLVNSEALDENMRTDVLPKGIRFNVISADFGNGKTHDPNSLVSVIFGEYFWKYFKNDILLFDYDDTIVGRNNTHKKASEYNKGYLWAISRSRKISIITGNSMRAINLIPQEFDSYFPTEDLLAGDITIFADGGVNYHTMNLNNYGYLGLEKKIKDKGCINPNILFSNAQVKDIIGALENVGIKSSKIQNRNNATISIKPIEDEYRKPLSQFFKRLLTELPSIGEDNLLNVRPTGKTTIDISKETNNKTQTLEFILSGCDRNTRVSMLGDEIDVGGNDYEISQDPRVDFYHVKSPKETFVFLKTFFMINGQQKWGYVC